MRLSHMCYQPWRPDHIADTPASRVESLAEGADCECQSGDLRVQGRHADEGGVVEAIVDLIGKDEDGVLDADGGDGFQLLAAEDLAEGVVTVWRALLVSVLSFDVAICWFSCQGVADSRGIQDLKKRVGSWSAF